MPAFRAASPAPPAHDDLIERLLQVRGDTEALVAGLSDADCTVQSMPDASPAKWHLAHTSWFFEQFVLAPHLPGYRVFDPAFRYLFNSYYDAVGPRQPRPQRGLLTRPTLQQVVDFRAHVDAGLARLDPDGAAGALLELGLHHEQQHQELLLTDLLHLFAQNPLSPACRPVPDRQPVAVAPPPLRWVDCPGGLALVGHAGEGFAFDNEGPRHRVWLDDFALADRAVTNADWQAFMADGGYSTPSLWLADGLAYYSAALYLEQANGPEAFQAELNDLSVLALKFESKGPIRSGYDLGYQSETYQSVVAGKGAWVLNMLRELLGRSGFAQLLRQYLAECTEQGGSTGSFEKLAASVYGKELRWFFAQWIDTTGVPELQADYVIFRTIDGFRVSGTVSQARDLFRMPLDVQVVTKAGVQTGSIMLDGKSTPFDIETATWPERVVLDPGGKILRDSPELQIAVQITLGAELKEKGDFVGAVRAYENALKRNPRSSLAHFRLAEVFFEQSNLNSAADSFRNALNGDKNPPWTEVWSYIYLGKIFDILGQRQRALAEYNKALNTKDDTFGAQAEAKKWLATPYTKEAMEPAPPD